MIIKAIRHTSVDVPSGICYGKSDVALASSFSEEGRLLSESMAGAAFDRCYSSPSQRCLQLARLLPGGMEVVTDERLMELDFGRWELTPWDDIYNSEEGREWFADYLNRRTPGGESFLDQRNRVEAFIRSVRSTGAGKILVVTHSGVIRSLFCLLEGLSPDEALKRTVEYGGQFDFEV